MKKFVCMALSIFFINSLFSQELKIGGGLAFGSEMGINNDYNEKMGLGINLKSGYGFTDKFIVMGNFNYFFPSTIEDMKLSAWQIAADGHYIFFGDDGLNLYGLAGLNYSRSNAEVTVLGITSFYNDSKIGVDMGFGVNLRALFGEIKYDTGFDQIQITLGVEF